MQKMTVATLASLVVAAAPLSAQTVYNLRVRQAMHPHGRYEPPICPLKGGDFRSSSAGLYLKTSAEGIQDDNSGGARSEVDSKKYIDIVGKAVKSASDAIQANPNNAAGWYFLGRADLQLGDVRGADSALTKLEALSPDCSAAIKAMRQQAWVPLVNPSSEFIRTGQTDSSLAVLRDALTIARYYPQGYYNLGATFVRTKQYDSALFYFQIAVEKSKADSQFAKTGQDATFNIATLYQQMNDYPHAIEWLKKYLALDPNNADAKRSLASTLRMSGNTAEAAQYESQLMSSGSLTVPELAMMGVRAFQGKDYAGAADAFQKVLVIEPLNHDAMYNLANTYLAMNDGKNLIDVSQKLIAIDPFGISNVKLLANGYRLTADTNKWVAAATQLQGMTVGVTIERFLATKDSATLIGSVSGNAAVDANDKTIPPAAMTLVFEFLDKQGAVVSAQEVPIQALQPNAKQDINLTVNKPGVIAWRYHKK
jgi:tetratricopeptide (TPR) repeat protein